ncbi:sensor histidine kinase [Lachnospiraceae bacterium WCA-9-b2]|jgi:Signal transduction histidine kinase|uniref:histidine kinase n=1 Tax=Sporofaciens musculi TaxID=2681861 RepID=A0A7X3MFG4_9FIRM|nr:sensor histidine kinase [Sporofaciens musculi]
MKAFRRLFALAFLCISIIFIGLNLLLKNMSAVESGRPYRVEINRIALQIEKNGFQSVDLSKCEYVNYIEAFQEDFYNSDSDYVICEINGTLYRFDYDAKNDTGNKKMVIMVNGILAVMSALVFLILLYIQKEILSPFERLKDVPYELSKGNLTFPVRENKNRFFGKFLWGIDMLRESMEQQKRRELELEREKKTLLLSLSHDIKTPLSAIKLYAKALSRNLYSDREKQRETAEKINEKADEIEHYVSRIITASREDFLSLEAEDGEFYLGELVQNIAAYYSEKLALVKTEFIIGEYQDCLIFGDFDRSVEVLQNLMENAIKYGDGKRITLGFSNDDEGVFVSVENSGCTLAESDLPHIFESFWRGRNSEKMEGSGLGLYICRQLMHKMNGDIFAEMNDGVIEITTIFRRV